MPIETLKEGYKILGKPILRKGMSISSDEFLRDSSNWLRYNTLGESMLVRRAFDNQENFSYLGGRKIWIRKNRDH